MKAPGGTTSVALDPAHQHLAADQLAGLEIHHRLVIRLISPHDRPFDLEEEIGPARKLQRKQQQGHPRRQATSVNPISSSGIARTVSKLTPASALRECPATSAQDIVAIGRGAASTASPRNTTGAPLVAKPPDGALSTTRHIARHQRHSSTNAETVRLPPNRCEILRIEWSSPSSSTTLRTSV